MRSEHKEFLKDLGNLIINITPISWAVSISHFTYKWGYRRRGAHRVAKRISFLQRKHTYRVAVYKFRKQRRHLRRNTLGTIYSLAKAPARLMTWLRWRTNRGYFVGR